MQKKQAKAKQHPEVELVLFENYSLSWSTLSTKNNRKYSKNVQKQVLLLNEVIWLMSKKIKLKMKNRSHRYDINRPRPRHGHKYTKYKLCLSIMMVYCIKQHPSNIWSLIVEKVKQHGGWVEKKPCL